MLSIAGTPTLQLQTALYAPIIGATNNFVNSTVKTPATDAKVSEATKNLFKVNTDNTSIIRNKDKWHWETNVELNYWKECTYC